MRQVVVVIAVVLLTLPIAALARAPYTPPGARDAVMRFSLRVNVSDRENCRPRTQEELEALPVHMRSPEECTRDDARFLLVFTIDGARADTIPLRRGGLRGDRPLVTVQERRLPPGSHHIQVELLRLTHDGAMPIAQLASPIDLLPGQVGLVTLDPGSNRLVLR
jgi:hypothetical protein